MSRLERTCWQILSVLTVLAGMRFGPRLYR